MALFSERNIKKVFIGAAIDRSSGVVAGALATPALLADGELVVTDMSNVILDTTTVLGRPMIKLVQGRGTKDPNWREEVLRLNEVHAYTGSAYSAAVEQVSYVGFNGTSGSIDVIPNNLYFLRISRITNTFLRGNQFIGKYGQFSSTDSSTQLEIATGLLKNLIANFKEEYKLEKDICFELVSGAASSTMTGPTSFTFTKGSKAVVYVGTDPTGPAVGDYLRVGTALTSAVYLITAINTATNTISIDVPFQNETAAAVLLTNVKYVTAAAIAAGNFGIKFSGRPFKFDILRWGQYDKIRFNLTLDGFGATSPTFTTAASEGSGVFEQVASDETLSWGKEGQAFIVQTPPLIREQDSSAAGTYSCLNIGFRNHVEHFVGAGDHFGNIIAYLNNPITGNTNYTGDTTSFVDVLDAYVAQNANFSAQVSNL